MCAAVRFGRNLLYRYKFDFCYIIRTLKYTLFTKRITTQECVMSEKYPIR